MVSCGYFDKCRFKYEQQLMQIVQLHSPSARGKPSNACQCDVARMHDSDILKNPKHVVLGWCTFPRAARDYIELADSPRPASGHRSAAPGTGTVTVMQALVQP
jgi:hypothetical protein